eukprot:TRINITY_DN24320_c0_g1_i2.p1 TRINITY_DN24320_c0_g1~~TRINITY_DN24320_c0_g1_i2.p1  ORF type:complete len:494 (-),score=53.56 TRINITY_DN24320_c0_g1_i2:371-1852(-)
MAAILAKHPATCALAILGLAAIANQYLTTLSSPVGPGQLTCESQLRPTVYFSERVVLPAASSAVPQPGSSAGWIHVGADGNLLHVGPGSRVDAAAYAAASKLDFIDYGKSVMSPGFIDVHTHISELGGRNWEGYETATRAAAAGGITTIIGMPLNSVPPTTTLEALDLEHSAANNSSLFVDVGYWGGVIPSSVGTDLEKLVRDERVLGIKAFLSPLPAAAGYQAVSPEELHSSAPAIAGARIPLLVHCELMSIEEIDELVAEAEAKNAPRKFETFLHTRPRKFEQRAIDVLISAADQNPDLRAHIVHLSDADSLERIRQARRRLGRVNVSGAASINRLTVETCPHYLAFSAEEIPDGETRLKCLPPIREAENRERLWAALQEGVIDMVATDHSPCTPDLRQLGSGNFLKAWAGLSGLQFGPAATWTAAKTRQFTESDLALWWSEEPAKFAGLWQWKGSLEEGKHADFVVWDAGVGALGSSSFGSQQRGEGRSV